MSTKIKNIGKCGALALLSQIPVVSAFSKFCEDFVHSSWQERIDAWQKEVVKQFSELDTNMEQKIRETSNFASLLASTQRAALEDPEENKLSLYVSSVINAIKNEKFTDVKKHIFLNFLRDFTLLHIEILKFLAISEKYAYEENTNTYFSQIHCASTNWYDIVNQCKPDIFNDEILYNLCYSELVTLKLLKNDNIAIHDRFDKRYPTKQTTSLADEFLAFISEQEAKNE